MQKLETKYSHATVEVVTEGAGPARVAANEVRQQWPSSSFLFLEDHGVVPAFQPMQHLTEHSMDLFQFDLSAEKVNLEMCQNETEDGEASMELPMIFLLRQYDVDELWEGKIFRVVLRPIGQRLDQKRVE